ncbi:hypothetical protein KJ969_01310 [Patescibacteria group bacterium]|nr:hypothetical protein [Patescibacteria group bacterium]
MKSRKNLLEKLKTLPHFNIATKLIRMTADKLNPKEQIILNKSALLSCELDDLLK